MTNPTGLIKSSDEYLGYSEGQLIRLVGEFACDSEISDDAKRRLQAKVTVLRHLRRDLLEIPEMAVKK